MKLYGKELKFGFASAPIYDAIAKENGFRSTNTIARNFMNTMREQAKKLGIDIMNQEDIDKKQNKLSNMEISFDIDINEAVALYASATNMTIKEAENHLDKSDASIITFPTEILSAFVSSSLMKAAETKEIIENPKKPK